MPILLPPGLLDPTVADRRRHPAIYLEVRSSATEPARPTDRAFLNAKNEVAAGALFLQVEQVYEARLDELGRLRALENGWDSYGSAAPQESAIVAVERSLEALKKLRAIPTA